MALSTQETVLVGVVVVGAIVAAIFHVLESTALAGILGLALGYSGKGVKEGAKRE